MNPTLITAPTTPQCPYCKSFALGEASATGYRQCATCNRYHQSHSAGTTPYSPVYTTCPKCAKNVYVSSSEWYSHKVHCSGCREYFTTTTDMVFRSSSLASVARNPHPGGSVGYDHHILIRMKGTPERLRRFHRLVGRCDADWPVSARRTTVRLCTKCMGVIWAGPRLSPTDLKAAARQVGGVKIKIRHFAPASACIEGSIKFLTIPETEELFLPGGPKALMEKFSLTTTPPLRPTVVPDSAPPTDDDLIGEVLNTGGPGTGDDPPAPEGSLSQSRTDADAEDAALLEAYGGFPGMVN